MPRLDFTAKAAAAIRALPRDPHLLKAIWRHLEQAATAPDDHIEPPALPYPHPLLTFRAFDSAGEQWAITAPVRFDRIHDSLLVILIHAGRIPEGLVGEEFD
jgi:hypothetical protein